MPELREKERAHADQEIHRQSPPILAAAAGKTSADEGSEGWTDERDSVKDTEPSSTLMRLSKAA